MQRYSFFSLSQSICFKFFKTWQTSLAYSCKPTSQTVGCDLSIDSLQEKLLSKNIHQITFYLKKESDCFQIKDTIFEDEMQEWKVKNVSMQGMAAFFCRA